ncbi:hypothetical protein [Paenibacillus cymbidii]|uniref:hypothetical protein n=1 Tax=Paenibacillus cymbidii TaxID=1639034 RepID=UPI00108170D8|nr:hypothetical protein [Paenibacillus cymbidii]
MNRVARAFKNGKIKTDAGRFTVDRAFNAHIVIAAADAVLGTSAACHAAVTDTGVQQVITTGITNPTYPRNVTATSGGTAGDIKAVQIIVEGTNFADEPITETLPAFTADSATTVSGNKAFKTITKYTQPPMDGTGATVSLGYGTKLGIPYKLAHNTVHQAFRNQTKEGTLPTVTVDAAALENNTMALSSALNGTQVDVYLLV